jgi:hypothetical protein
MTVAHVQQEATRELYRPSDRDGSLDTAATFSLLTRAKTSSVIQNLFTWRKGADNLKEKRPFVLNILFEANTWAMDTKHVISVH